MFNLPSGKRYRGYDTTQWREDMLQLLYQLRSPINAHFRKQIEAGKAVICSNHFEDTKIWKSKFSKFCVFMCK